MDKVKCCECGQNPCKLVSFDSCARCGQQHENLCVRQFINPPKLPEVNVTHFTMCPTTQQPILIVAGPDVS